MYDIRLNKNSLKQYIYPSSEQRNKPYKYAGHYTVARHSNIFSQ